MSSTRRCEIHVDGSSLGNPGPAGIGVVLTDGPNRAPHVFSKSLGRATNNVAEYLALIHALQLAAEAGYAHVSARTDSELLVRQITGRYKVRHPELKRLHGLVQQLISGFGSFQIRHVPREQNRLADRLAGEASRGRETAFGPAPNPAS